MKYKFLEHTADIKFKVFGESIEEIFENSVLAVSDFMTKGKKIDKNLKKEIEISGRDYEKIFYLFIDELIFLLDTQGFIASSAKIKISKKRNIILKAVLLGGNAKKYKHLDSIKSATYSEMYIKKTKTGWEAQAVVDV